MSECTSEPADDYTVTDKRFIAVDRITQELITQKIKAALEQVDAIAGAIREDGGAANLGLLYVSAVDARTYLEAALKELPWTPMAVEARRAVSPPPRAD